MKWMINRIEACPDYKQAVSERPRGSRSLGLGIYIGADEPS